MYSIIIKKTVSKAPSTLGWNIITLYEDNKKVASCNGGGYDMRGTVLGAWVEQKFKKELLMFRKPHNGLTFHDPSFRPGQVVPAGEEDTVDELEEQGKSLGLERYQATYSGSSELPTEAHIIPNIDGAYGWESVVRILETIGYRPIEILSNEKMSVFNVLPLELANEIRRRHIEEANAV